MSVKMLISVIGLGVMMTGAAMAQDFVAAPAGNLLHSTYRDCRNVQQNIQDKLPEQNDETQKMAHNARSFCSLGQYAYGMARYETVLQMMKTK